MSIWCQNLWDELILKNEIKLLREKYWDNTRFKVFSYDFKNPFFDEDRVDYIEYFPIWIKNPKNIIRNIRNFLCFIKTIRWSDKVVIWWWWIFFDNEVWSYTNPLSQWLFRVNIISILKKDLIFYWVSLDIKNKKNYSKIKNIFKKSSEIYVRDKISYEFLANLWINSNIIKDPVFYDIWDYIDNPSLELKSLDVKDFSIADIKDISFSDKKVWIAFRGWMIHDEKKVVKEIINFIIKSWWEVVLLPHSFHKIDKKANDFEFLSQFVWDKVTITKSMQETYLYYKQKKIDLCLSMRLHSVILSKVYHIKYVKFIYADKLKWV